MPAAPASKSGTLEIDLDRSDREIHLTRTFDAPRELVFKAWTTPRHIQKWLGPQGFTITTTSIDLKQGGAWIYTMHGPDGTDWPNRMRFTEIVRPARIVYVHDEGKDDGAEQQRFEVTVTFRDDGPMKCLLDFRMVFAKPELRELAFKHGAIAGAQQTMDKLAAEVAAMAPAVGVVHFERILDAPRELAFKVWTDPAHIAKWWGPHKFTLPECSLDLRPGGVLRIIMRAPDGTDLWCKGEVREVKAPELFVFTNIAATMDGEHLAEGLTTVTFADMGAKTKLTVDSRSVLIKDGWEAAIAGMRTGWSQQLERLEAYVPTAGA